MFRIDTDGLHGQVIELITSSPTEGVAIVKRDNATQSDFPYSTHRIGAMPEGLMAWAGHYDLTLDEARRDLAARAGRL